MKIRVNTKAAGKLRQGVKTVEMELAGVPHDVRSLIVQTVDACVESFKKRAAAGEVMTMLTNELLSEMAGQGKVAFSEIYGSSDVDMRSAEDNALRCFEDGIYRIFLDGKQLDGLDEKITLGEESELTFVRLTMLAGRLW